MSLFGVEITEAVTHRYNLAAPESVTADRSTKKATACHINLNFFLVDVIV